MGIQLSLVLEKSANFSCYIALQWPMTTITTTQNMLKWVLNVIQKMIEKGGIISLKYIMAFKEFFAAFKWEDVHYNELLWFFCCNRLLWWLSERVFEDNYWVWLCLSTCIQIFCFYCDFFGWVICKTCCLNIFDVSLPQCSTDSLVAHRLPQWLTDSFSRLHSSFDPQTFSVANNLLSLPCYGLFDRTVTFPLW